MNNLKRTLMFDFWRTLYSLTLIFDGVVTGWGCRCVPYLLTDIFFEVGKWGKVKVSLLDCRCGALSETSGCSSGKFV